MTSEKIAMHTSDFMHKRKTMRWINILIIKFERWINYDVTIKKITLNLICKILKGSTNDAFAYSKKLSLY